MITPEYSLFNSVTAYYRGGIYRSSGVFPVAAPYKEFGDFLKNGPGILLLIILETAENPAISPYD